MARRKSMEMELQDPVESARSRLDRASKVGHTLSHSNGAVSIDKSRWSARFEFFSLKCCPIGDRSAMVIHHSYHLTFRYPSDSKFGFQERYHCLNDYGNYQNIITCLSVGHTLICV